MSDCLSELELNRYHDGEEPTLGAHVEQCLNCRAQLRELRQLDEAVTGPVEQGTSRAVRPWRWALVASLMIVTVWITAMSRQSDVRNYEMAVEDGTVYKISTQGGARLLSLEVEGTVAYFEKE